MIPRIFHCTMSKIPLLNFNFSKIFFVYFEFYVVVVLGKFEWWYKVSYLLPKEPWFTRFKFSRPITLSNGYFNNTCLFFFFSFLYIFFSYLKGYLLKTKLNIVVRLIKCKMLNKFFVMDNCKYLMKEKLLYTSEVP